ncbi:RbsD/FucU domain-containing protein [Novipirellula artificiosorum]|uniref:D-ribose pyranase n=1 Tax=Novipirellula artificiosorum TaxID=2528016 RepID=A0A5C6DGX8_9BACT|nr:RbsD/FucU domain-containing protein [Novipirellula artificiosorum]TWU36100.1 hypothetical protein Poly41_38530 [Novipirellula artificiosorum]
MHKLLAFTFLVSLFAFASPARAQTDPRAEARSAAARRAVVQNRLDQFGHRNWIVIADSAYPSQTAAGIETIVTHQSQLQVVREVIDAVGNAKHVRPTVYLDKEIKYVDEQNAAGISDYRSELLTLLAGQNVKALPHEEIIAKLDEAGKTFHVLILKSNMTLPYTSVFIELDCGYWSAEAEASLRKTMNLQAD